MPAILLIDQENWDLCVDAALHIAVANEPYSLAQGAACAIKSFIGENYYNTTLGIPYKQQILGHTPPLALVKAQLSAAAKTVPGVAAARTFVSSFEDGLFTGQVQVVDATGITSIAGF